jgi:hypothetical protein
VFAMLSCWVAISDATIKLKIIKPAVRLITVANKTISCLPMFLTKYLLQIKKGEQLGEIRT